MEKRPISRVSVGLPVYNGADYLEEALDSLLDQTFEDFELIISDNASTDGTEAICRAYALCDARIRYMRSTTNRGAAANYNLVLETARGEYFRWAAHDDKIAPEFLLACVQALDSDPEIVLAYARVTHIDANGDCIENYESGFNLEAPSAVDRFRQFFNAPYKCTPVFGLMRTDVIRRTNRHGNYIGADRILLGQLSLFGKFHEIPQYLFFRRIHPQISTEANKNSRDLAAWFDPANRRKILLPLWKHVVEYQKVILGAPISPKEKMQCLAIMLRNQLPPRRWPALGKELVGGALQGLARLLPVRRYPARQKSVGRG